MNCKKCRKLIDLYVDNCISDSDYEAVLHHINDCEECSAYYNVLRNMVDDLGNIEQVELPEGYGNKLHFALKRAGEKEKMPGIMRKRKVLIASLSAVCALILVVASANIVNDGFMMKSEEAMPMMESADYAENEMVMEEAAAEEAVEEAPAEPAGGSAKEVVTRDEEKEETSLGSENTDGGEQDSESIDCLCTDLFNGDSIVIHLNVEDIDTVYKKLNEELMPFDPMPKWALHTDEPAEYRAIRCLDDVEAIGKMEIKIIGEYAGMIESYYSARVEYEDIDTEMVGLQNHGYLFIVIE